MGRTFTADEDEHSQQVAVLSFATWVSRFHRDGRVLGTAILLDRKPYNVIGVMPRNFEFPLNPGQLNRSEMWVPMSFQPDELGPAAAANWSYKMLGRLKPGVSPEQAETDAETVAQRIMRNYPAMMANLHISAMVRPLQLDTTEQARPLLRTLFLAVAVVLLIACVNLAGLMLVRLQAVRGEDSSLFDVSPFDPVVLSVAAVGVLLLALAASGLPALRAASIDPILALRGE